MLTISTDSISSAESSEFWDEQFAKLMRLQSTRTEPIGKNPFRGCFQMYSLSDGIQLSRLELESARIACKGNLQADHLSLMVPLAGEDEACWDGKAYRVSAGNIYIINSVEEAGVLTSGRVTRLGVVFPKSEIRKVFPYIDAPRFKGIHVMSTQNEAAGLLASDVRDFYGAVDGFRQRGQVGSFLIDRLCRVLHSLTQNSEDARSQLRYFHKERIRTFVKSNLHANLSIASIASAVNLSQSYIYNLFANEPVSLMKWVWLQRLERCRRDLVSPALRGCSIREIAYAWGFNDPAHFTHVFHQNFGMPPTEYREQRRNETGAIFSSFAFSAQDSA